MIGPFRISISRHLTLLDFDALPSNNKDTLFNGIAYQPDRTLIGRLSIAILDDPNFRGPKHIRWRKSYERVTQLYVHISLTKPSYEIQEVFPHTTLAPGQNDPQLDIGISVDPLSGKFTISGALKNLIRQQRHLILNTHTSDIAQWVFQKNYLRDNFQYNLDFLLNRKEKIFAGAALICEVKANEGGRLIRATRKKIMLESVESP